jgi:hypothetical protein
VDDAVVAVQVDLHFAVGIQVDVPPLGGDIEFQHAAAPHGQVDLAVVVADAVVPDLLHRGVLLGVDLHFLLTVL